MANQLSRTDSSSNQDIRQRFNVKKTIIGVIVLLIGLCHLPEAILLIMDSISLDSILYLIGIYYSVCLAYTNLNSVPGK